MRFMLLSKYALYVVTNDVMMLEYFIRGLRPELQDAMIPLMCETVEAAAQRAAILERTIQSRQSGESGTNISCKGSVDTTITGVDTMAQSKGRNVKKRTSSVDTTQSQIDTTQSQVDTSEPSQKTCFSANYGRSTLLNLRPTLEPSPRESIGQSGTVCRHYSRAGQHTTESLELKLPPGHVAP
ncbi:hypothetical protein Taro_032138 [Colocasia esculenta]|uniref:Uncharacterized protein n=1 Tax=Colocasia esculenta TaxID=4460 RepID=A0A843W307_COLES|nr:hypothetical protein [Colocasia esculenta]